jgi:hypothetical protein
MKDHRLLTYLLFLFAISECDCDYHGTEKKNYHDDDDDSYYYYRDLYHGVLDFTLWVIFFATILSIIGCAFSCMGEGDTSPETNNNNSDLSRNPVIHVHIDRRDIEFENSCS